MSDSPESDRMPDVDYLSAALELTESGRGEMRKLALSPCFDEPRMEISVVEAAVVLNRRQIECLADFLAGWLEHVK
jgi:hypothetical protein